MEELLLEESLKGSYAAVKFSKATVKRLKQFCLDNDIPNPLRSDKFHTTLLYSRKHLPNYKAQGDIDPPWIGKPTGFDVWETQPKKDGGDPSRCLVLLYDCEELTNRHNELMKTHKAQYDHAEYHSHITLSYNIGNMKIKNLLDKLDDLGDIEIVSEYGEDLDLDYVANL